MPKEELNSPRNERISDVPASGEFPIGEGRAKFSELFSSLSKEKVGDTTYCYLNKDLEEASQAFENAVNILKRKNIMGARRSIRNRFRGVSGG